MAIDKEKTKRNMNRQDALEGKGGISRGKQEASKTNANVDRTIKAGCKVTGIQSR